MKYPILRIKKATSLFKHGSKAMAFHFGYNSAESDDLSWNRYRTYLIDEVAKALEGQFVINQATIIKSNNETFVVFKENVDLKILESFVKGLMHNLDECLEGKEKFHYALLKVMILEDGKNVSIFNANKVGEDVLKSEQYVKAKVNEDPSKYSSKVNYLIPYDLYLKNHKEEQTMYYI